MHSVFVDYFIVKFDFKHGFRHFVNYLTNQLSGNFRQVTIRRDVGVGRTPSIIFADFIRYQF